MIRDNTVCEASVTIRPMAESLSRLWRRLQSLLYFCEVHPFFELRLATAPRLQARIPIDMVRHDRACECPPEVLRRIKGKTKDWRSRWKRGDVCYVAYAGGEPAAYIWICRGQWRLQDEDEGRPLPPKSAFLYDALTREPWRGNGVYQALITRAVDELISGGYKALYLSVNDRNRPACRAPEKAGFLRTEHHICLYRLLKVFHFRHDAVSLGDGH